MICPIRQKTKHNCCRECGASEGKIDGDGECEEVLQLVASCRGALNGLMSQLIEGHLRFHVLPPELKSSVEQREAADELLAVTKRYFT